MGRGTHCCGLHHGICCLVHIHHYLGDEMRWAILLILLLSFLVLAQQTRCNPIDLYNVSWIGNPSTRHEQMSIWLTRNGDTCSAEQLVGIWNKLAEWAGVADSQELRGKVLYFYERAVQREKSK